MPTVRLMLRTKGRRAPGSLAQRVKPERDEIDLDRLSPRARALAEAIAESVREEANTIRISAPAPEPLADDHRRARGNFVNIDGNAGTAPLPRADWSDWTRFYADDSLDPHEWLERQAERIPAGCEILGPGTYSAGYPVQPGLTVTQVCDMLWRRWNIRVEPSTWRGYVARGQAPEAATRIGRTPLWDPDQIETWVAERPGQGTRTDLATDVDGGHARRGGA